MRRRLLLLLIIEILLLLLLLSSTLVVGVSPLKFPSPGDANEEEEENAINDDADEPPVNPFLADSPWAQTQRNSYQQGSSNWPGPTAEDELAVDFLPSFPVSITAVYSNLDDNNNRAIWENNVLLTGKISRSKKGKEEGDENENGLSVIDRIFYPPSVDGFSGAYYLIDRDDVFFAGRQRTLGSFTNAVKGDTFSGIVKVDEYDLLKEGIVSKEDSLRGLNLLYDGFLVFTTSLGIVGVIRRDFTDLQTIRLGSDDDEEIISNSHAVDEDGGIYVVTSKKMYRLQWDNGTTLSIRWSAEYDVGPENPAAGRLGAGSGSTPSLMGTGSQEDKFVVITDGQELMHLVLFWRDEIPDGWVAIAPDKDRRIAAEVPVTFGDPSAISSLSEQSVLVRGYGAAVVNNDYGLVLPQWLPEVVAQLFILLSGTQKFAPYGVEKFEWNSETRTLESAWANKKISCPNGIPTMSSVTNLMYCVGQRDSVWNIEAMNWDTGDSVFYKELGKNILTYNSAYAALVVGVDHELVSGAAAGVFRVRVKD